MATAKVSKGAMCDRWTPKWQPLVDLVGEEVTGDFMWMHEVELEDGTSLQAYKHIDTRRYIHLGSDGAAFAYEEPDRYRTVDPADALTEIFTPLVPLAGVTARQLAASWGAVARLR